MALSDPQVGRRDRRRGLRDRGLGALAVCAVIAVIAVWSFELGRAEPVVFEGFSSTLSMAAAVVLVAWLIMSQVNRLERHLQRIEGERYRDGYAAGYLDAAARFREGGQYDRPSLRPVK